MSERLCQFFIRGRCLRDVCEFQHPADLSSATKESGEPLKSEEVPLEMPAASDAAKKASGFESDEDVRAESDGESIASGFTEKPVEGKKVPEKQAETADASEEPAEAPNVVEKPTEADLVVEEPTEADLVVEEPAEADLVVDEPEEDHVADKPETAIAVEEPTEPNNVAEDKAQEEAPQVADGDASIIEVSSTIKAHQEPPAEEAWNFAASAAAAVTGVAMTSTPLLPRRAAKSAQSQATAASKEVIAPGEARQKSIRRDAKGFELLEDYFSDSETDKSTDKTSPVEKTAEEASDVVSEASEEPEAMEVDPPQNPSTILNADKKAQNSHDEQTKKTGNVVAKKSVPPKSAVDELTRDWDDDDTSSQADGGETIESIESFMQGNSASEVPKEVTSKDQTTTKKKVAETSTVVAEKSVYDLDPDELDEQTATKTNYKGEPKPALQTRRQKNLIKKEGVTKIGNNVYYYTGKEDNEEGASEGEEEEEEEEDEEWEENDFDDNGSTADTTNDEEKTTSSRRTGISYALGRRKHNTSYVYGARSSAKKTRRCGECEGCNREECAQCPTCLDKPKFGGSGLKKQACIYRVCIWKNPSGKKVPGARNQDSTPTQSRRKEPVASSSATASPALGTRTTRRSIAVIASAAKETPPPAPTVTPPPPPPPPTQPARRGRPPGSGKRKLELEKKSPPKKQKTVSNGTAEEEEPRREENGQPAAEASQESRSVTVNNEDEDEREVVVNCFAPYDEHKWTNIGKKKEGVEPQAVQYARALRPPYHLLSFLKIQGHSSKGSSSTNKNTMVFIVLQGQITVELHRTKLVAKPGDSFYIPPRNFYNLINETSEVAELTLMQFQYDGPLSSAGSKTADPK